MELMCYCCHWYNFLNTEPFGAFYSEIDVFQKKDGAVDYLIMKCIPLYFAIS